MAKEFLSLSVFSWSERKIWLLQPQSPKKTLDSHGKFWKMLPAKKKSGVKVQQFYPASDCTSLRFLACFSSRVDQRIGDVGVALLCQTARVESLFTFVGDTVDGRILHHQGCIKPLQIMGYLPYRRKISSINSKYCKSNVSLMVSINVAYM